MTISHAIGFKHLEVGFREHALIAQDLAGPLPFKPGMAVQVFRPITDRYLLRLRLDRIHRPLMRIALQ
jgi:hypothetical protein